MTDVKQTAERISTERLERIAASDTAHMGEAQRMATELLASRASAQEGGEDSDRMQKISEVIEHLQSIKERFGNTCVYIRRGGMSWGAVALNYRDDDKKHGVFDLQAKHDRDMIARAEQVERLIAERNELRAQVAAPSNPVISAALRVFAEWSLDVATLSELADLESRMNAVGVTLNQVGEWADFSVNPQIKSDKP